MTTMHPPITAALAPWMPPQQRPAADSNQRHAVLTPPRKRAGAAPPLLRRMPRWHGLRPDDDQDEATTSKERRYEHSRRYPHQRRSLPLAPVRMRRLSARARYPRTLWVTMAVAVVVPGRAADLGLSWPTPTAKALRGHRPNFKNDQGGL